MAGGFYLSDRAANFTSLNQVTTTGSVGTVSTTTVNTKGAYTQITASTANDVTGVIVHLSTQPSSSNLIALDIAIGASGSETIIIPNVYTGTQNAFCDRTEIFPVTIPAGTRIAARGQSAVANDTPGVALTLIDDASLARSGGIIDSYGFLTASTTGTVIDAGAVANTKGSWVQITSATTSDLAGFCFHLDHDNQTIAASNQGLLDVGIGASGSEVVIISNYAYRHIQTFGAFPTYSPWYSIEIPAGTRIAVRAQCSSTTTTDRVLGFILYGLRG